jgi:hypothetical protein
MSIVRKAAQKISAMVVRYASPGCKEWAEGLAREIDFIGDDWKALLWSIGSVRVLLDRQPAPILTLEDAQTLAKKFAERMQNFNGTVYLFTAMLNGTLLFLRSFRGGIVNHVAAVIGGVGWATLGVCIYLEGKTKQKMIEDKGLPELVLVYRMEQEKLAHWRRRPMWWIEIGAALCMVVGVIASFHFSWTGYCFALLIPVGIAVCIHGVCNARRRLQELDALLNKEA